MNVGKTKPEHIAKKLEAEAARDCPECRKAKQTANEERGKKRRSCQEKVYPRETLLGCRLDLHYLALGSWTGNAVDILSGKVVATGKATSLRKLLALFNEGWTKWKETPNG